MLEFIINNLGSILVIVLLIILVLFLYLKGKKKLVAQIILSLVAQAEQTFGSGRGELKYAFVVERLYGILPGVVRVFFSRKEIDNLIEVSVEHLKLFFLSK